MIRLKLMRDEGRIAMLALKEIGKPNEGATETANTLRQRATMDGTNRGSAKAALYSQESGFIREVTL